MYKKIRSYETKIQIWKFEKNTIRFYDISMTKIMFFNLRGTKNLKLTVKFI